MDLVSRAPTKRRRDPLRRLFSAALLALGSCAATDSAGIPGDVDSGRPAGPDGVRRSPDGVTQSPDGVTQSAAQGTQDLELALASEPFHRLTRLELTLNPEEDALVSQVIEDGSAFDEAIPSWNVLGPRPFAVDIRVGNPGSHYPGSHSPGDPNADLAGWSPWLRIGDWNVSNRTGLELTKFAGGKVAVDVLRVDAPKQLAQLAFRALDGGLPLAPSDVHAYLALTDRTELPARAETAASEPWPKPHLIEVAPRSQRQDGGEIGGRICSPTSVAMVAGFHGADVPTTQMAATILDPHYDIYGNWNRAVQGAFAHGVSGRVARFSSWEAVRRVLATGRPIVASIRASEGEISGAPYTKTAGHLLVITGLDAHGVVHVNDPAARTAGEVSRMYLRADMERVWFEKGGVAYVLGTDPKASGTSDSTGAPKAPHKSIHTLAANGAHPD